MSELRIRSEAIPDEAWPESFVPLPARAAAVDDVDEGDFAPLVAEAARALTRLFGRAVKVAPGRPSRPEQHDVRPQVSPALAAALATLAMGGELPGDGEAGAPPAGGVSLARHARQLAQVLDGVAERLWPTGCRAAGFDLDIGCGAVSGHVHVAAPACASLQLPPPPPATGLAARVLDLPMRVRVELASGMTAVATLLPLHCGTVLPIDPLPEMPLLMGDHCIGRVTLAPLPDGRQQATIVAMRVEPYGEMP